MLKEGVTVKAKTEFINWSLGTGREEEMTSEELIAYCAKVSNTKSQDNMSTMERLMAFLKRNCHWSPFEMVDVIVEVITTRDIGRQILRHRSFCFQEFSQRYAEPTELGFTTRPARLQDEKNRQNSIAVDDDALDVEWRRRQELVIATAKEHYEWARQNNIAKELARVVLPEGLTLSKMYMKGSVRSWIHYLALRTDPSTQREHRDIATAIRDRLRGYFPNVFSE